MVPGSDHHDSCAPPDEYHDARAIRHGVRLYAVAVGADQPHPMRRLEGLDRAVLWVGVVRCWLACGHCVAELGYVARCLALEQRQVRQAVPSRPRGGPVVRPMGAELQVLAASEARGGGQSLPLLLAVSLPVRNAEADDDHHHTERLLHQVHPSAAAHIELLRGEKALVAMLPQRLVEIALQEGRIMGMVDRVLRPQLHELLRGGLETGRP
mmetsp:Transcript_82859/g.239705  ORF Transcript_82859/g.239705 Transcript_82859/m.239705 type:complete len:211 (-) Transcript_82859:534-1166(-)